MCVSPSSVYGSLWKCECPKADIVKTITQGIHKATFEVTPEPAVSQTKEPVTKVECLK